MAGSSPWSGQDDTPATLPSPAHRRQLDPSWKLALVPNSPSSLPPPAFFFSVLSTQSHPLCTWESRTTCKNHGHGNLQRSFHSLSRICKGPGDTNSRNMWLVPNVAVTKGSPRAIVCWVGSGQSLSDGEGTHCGPQGLLVP